jgi:hypothetical protein
MLQSTAQHAQRHRTVIALRTPHHTSLNFASAVLRTSGAALSGWYCHTSFLNASFTYTQQEMQQQQQQQPQHSAWHSKQSPGGTTLRGSG